MNVAGSCIHGISLGGKCFHCTAVFTKFHPHDYEPWTMQCRGCGWMKGQIDNWAKMTRVWDTCRGVTGPVPGDKHPQSEKPGHRCPKDGVLYVAGDGCLFCGELPTAPTRRTRVYVSGPLTTGSMTGNVRAAALAADELLAAGFAVYLPHTNVLWEMIVPPDGDPYEKWLAHDFEWVAACDVILRLDGESHGADREVELARKLGRPVYESVGNLMVLVPRTRPR